MENALVYSEVYEAAGAAANTTTFALLDALEIGR